MKKTMKKVKFFIAATLAVVAFAVVVAPVAAFSPVDQGYQEIQPLAFTGTINTTTNLYTASSGSNNHGVQIVRGTVVTVINPTATNGRIQIRSGSHSGWVNVNHVSGIHWMH